MDEFWENHIVECQCRKYAGTELYSEEDILNHVFEHFEDFEDEKVVLKVVKRPEGE